MEKCSGEASTQRYRCTVCLQRLPYSIEKLPLLLVLWEDLDGLYSWWLLSQLLYQDDESQRSDEPVSKSTTKFCAGLPMVMDPVHSRSSSSVSLTPPRFSSDVGTVRTQCRNRY